MINSKNEIMLPNYSLLPNHYCLLHNHYCLFPNHYCLFPAINWSYLNTNMRKFVKNKLQI